MKKEDADVSQINIVLFEPEIPQNTGNIAPHLRRHRLHAPSHRAARLYGDRQPSQARGAGLLEHLDIRYYPNIDAFFAQNADGRCFFFTKKAQRRFTDVSYAGTCYLVFGKETKGLPEPLLRERAGRLRGASRCARANAV